MAKKAKRAKRTRRAPAAAVVTQAQARDWHDRVQQVEQGLRAITPSPAAHEQMAQQQESLAASLAAVREEIAEALKRAD